MIDMKQLIEKFKAKLLEEEGNSLYKNESVRNIVNRVFVEEFAKIFESIVNEINNKLNIKLLSYQLEGKSRFIVEGRYHRIYFQKGKIDQNDEVIQLNIIPICVWKGVTKHLGPICAYINQETLQIKWDIPFENPEIYAMDVFNKLVDDTDFSM
ncbi:MAG: hypothetical protein WCK67_06475 [bacterium]